MIIWFGPGIICPRPLFHWASSLPTIGVKPLFFHQKNRTVSVSTGTLPFASVIVVAVRQNPQGGGVLALTENVTDLSIPHCKFSSAFWSTVES